jgi:hypothetical protein
MIVYSKPMSGQGEANRINTSYHSGPASVRRTMRIIIAAPSGIPRNAATLTATTEHDILTPAASWPITRMKKTASGAQSTICRTELMATGMAQYSQSPPASCVQTRTCKQEVSASVVGFIMAVEVDTG